MCSECRQTPCSPRCPNNDDKPVMTCHCGALLYDGDDYWEIGGVIACEACLDMYERTAEVDYAEF